MEVEFLSNVRYNLYASEEEWAQWHTKLGVFSDFFNRAVVIPDEVDLRPTTPVLRISPSLRATSQLSSSTPSKLPSPPAVEGCWGVVAGMLGTSVCDETGRLGRGRWGIGPGM